MTDAISTDWTLTDEYEPHIYRNGDESFSISSEGQLRQLLSEYVSKDPRMLIIEHPEIGQIFVAVGGASAGVRYYSIPANHRSVAAKVRGPIAQQDKWFVAEGDLTRIKADELIPKDTMFEIVIQLVKRAELSGLVDWI